VYNFYTRIIIQKLLTENISCAKFDNRGMQF